MVDRVAEPSGTFRRPLIGTTAEQLDGFEQAVQSEAGVTLREYLLGRLHEDTVEAFVNSPGFGVARGVGFPTEERLKPRLERGDTPVQPGPPVIWGYGEPFGTVPDTDQKRLAGLHASGLLDFVNAREWGYVQSRSRVAGFLSHRFSRVPEIETWRVQRIELVGLLKHPEPVVYVSDRLPAMIELPSVPTRPLDTFEEAGLGAVRRGEDGFAARRGDVIRFVGGIRSARQCVECHGGERGDLLGAFSYALLPARTRP